MKRYKSRFFSLILVLALMFTFPAFASVRASDQLSDYDMNARAIGDGEIAIKFSVRAADNMVKIGSSRILVYENINGRWFLVEDLDMDDPDMIATDVNYHSDTLHFSGFSGTEYRIYVEVYAEDYAGKSDSRAETFYVTA